ncbi:MAG: hypothetical protein ACI389_05255 [Methanobrevibacter sp.]|uniref:hypothetical protein n=1 Tax=Methanobrevibacter sp. TaxID=66852 RepID=UPI003EFD4AA2
MTSNVHKRMKTIHDENRLTNLNTDEKPPIGPKPIWLLSDGDIMDEWNKSIEELSQKEKKLLHVKDEYSQKEFNIKYVDDIDFKELYGRANDDTRAHHVRITLKELINEKNELELRVDYLTRRISFLKAVIYHRMEIKS